jgi:hypothetical protein
MQSFNVIPIKEWYHFKGIQTSQFTAEEAEKFVSYSFLPLPSV